MSTQISCSDAQMNLDQLCDRVVETGEAAALKRSKLGEVQPQAIDELYQRFGLGEGDLDKEITSAN